MNCKECGLHFSSKNAKLFCNRSCAAKFNNRTRKERGWIPSVEQRLKASIANKGNIPKNKGRTAKIIRQCVHCDSEFIVYPSSSKIYCSRKCNPNMGGFREGSGRAKTGYYKGIYCGSTYELAWVIYQLDHNIPFERFNGCLEYQGKKYFPDFLQNGIIIEIKGYESKESVEFKSNIAEQNGYKVVVLRKDELSKVFEWVRINYTSDFKTLYDQYRPTFTYNCSFCGKEFGRDKKSKYKKVCCSRSCSLKLNRKTSG